MPRPLSATVHEPSAFSVTVTVELPPSVDTLAGLAETSEAPAFPSAGPTEIEALVPVLETLRERSEVPIAVGFGIKDRSHVEGVGAVGADAAILGVKVWKETARTTPLDNVIDVHIARLRRKVDLDQSIKLIHTVRGVWFMLREGEP